MNRCSPLLAALVAALITNTACTNSQNGHAHSGPIVENTTSAAITTPNTPPAEPVSTSIDPCTLLDPEQDLTTYGQFKEPQYKELAGARSCSWQRAKANPLDESLLIGLDIRDGQTVKTMNDVGGGVNPGEINGRPAAEAPSPQYHECTLGLGLDDQSRIDVGIVGPDDVNDACQVARDIAYLIEPRLPDTTS